MSLLRITINNHINNKACLGACNNVNVVKNAIYIKKTPMLFAAIMLAMFAFTFTNATFMHDVHADEQESTASANSASASSSYPAISPDLSKSVVVPSENVNRNLYGAKVGTAPPYAPSGSLEAENQKRIANQNVKTISDTSDVPTAQRPAPKLETPLASKYQTNQFTGDKVAPNKIKQPVDDPDERQPSAATHGAQNYKFNDDLAETKKKGIKPYNQAKITLNGQTVKLSDTTSSTMPQKSDVSRTNIYNNVKLQNKIMSYAKPASSSNDTIGYDTVVAANNGRITQMKPVTQFDIANGDKSGFNKVNAKVFAASALLENAALMFLKNNPQCKASFFYYGHTPPDIFKSANTIESYNDPEKTKIFNRKKNMQTLMSMPNVKVYNIYDFINNPNDKEEMENMLSRYPDSAKSSDRKNAFTKLAAKGIFKTGSSSIIYCNSAEPYLQNADSDFFAFFTTEAPREHELMGSTDISFKIITPDVLYHDAGKHIWGLVLLMREAKGLNIGGSKKLTMEQERKYRDIVDSKKATRAIQERHGAPKLKETTFSNFSAYKSVTITTENSNTGELKDVTPAIKTNTGNDYGSYPAEGRKANQANLSATQDIGVVKANDHNLQRIKSGVADPTVIRSASTNSAAAVGAFGSASASASESSGE